MDDLPAANDNATFDVAIIGLSGRFPGAKNIKEFWQNLLNGTESISFFTDQELIQSGVSEKDIKNPNYIRARGILEDEDKFDASFFGFFPKEAEQLDPQHRLFLECAWECFEDAGYSPDNFKGLVGVFGGVGVNTYIFPLISATQGQLDTAEGYQISIGNEKDFLTTKISYKMDLHGPSIDVQTACSTSLTAVFLACQSLLNFQSDMAIAGGCTITIPQKSGFTYQEGMILSPDGHCRAFDAAANGTVPGNGCGVVLLKRLEDALADRDNIYAIIKGAACNNDGAVKVGYTAPSIEGQAQVIAEAQYAANVESDDISYIETHGTGTNLGDPIEITALNKVFMEKTKRKQFCPIGSVKTNIGHLDAAAGVASLIKTALALKYKTIPPSINFSEPNPKLDITNSPFFVNNTCTEWKTDKLPRRAGVSSFGIGGTNVHLVLQEAPEQNSPQPLRKSKLLLFSAKSKNALDHMRINFAEFLRANPKISLSDAACTLQVGRKAFNHRLALVADSNEDAAKTLGENDAARLLYHSIPQDTQNRNIVFMFSGQGSQYVNMGQGLYLNEPTFRDAMIECCETIESFSDLKILDILYPRKASKENRLLQQTKVTQPALFTIEYALAQLLNEWGIVPDALIGHSIGEYVAACYAGVLKLEDALQLVVTRGELMQQQPSGSMLSVHASEKEISSFLGDQISLAAVNSENLVVLSGPSPEIDELTKTLNEKNIACRQLYTSHAFHSPMMEPIVDKFRDKVSQIELLPPEIPYISNLTGTWITEDQATDPDYYAQQLRHPVRFSNGIKELFDSDNYIFLEVGPGNALTTFVKHHPQFSQGTIALSSIHHPKDQKDDQVYIMNMLATMWLAGRKINWQGFYAHEDRRHVSLPSYPFEKKRFFLDIKPLHEGRAVFKNSKNPNIGEWFYYPSWKRSDVVRSNSSGSFNYLYFISNDQDIETVNNIFEQTKSNVLFITPASEFKEIKSNVFSLNPENEQDYAKLIEIMISNKIKPDRVIFSWQNIEMESKSFYSLLWFVKHLAAFNFFDQLSIKVITENVFDIVGSESINPENGLLIGLCKVIPQEFPNINCQLIDAGDSNVNTLLLEDFDTPHRLIAYRGGHRWIECFEKLDMAIESQHESIIKNDGTYVITGGLGDIGLHLASMLAEQYKVNLILIDKFKLPDKKEWDSSVSANSVIKEKIDIIKRIEKAAHTLVIYSCDVSDKQEMEEIFGKVEAEFDKIDGVFHLAGLVGEKAALTIQDMDRTKCNEQFLPKVDGVDTLSFILKNRQIDFVILQSSLASVLGGLGMAAYASANAYLDVIAETMNKNSTTKWSSINWDGWNFDKKANSVSQVGMEEYALDPGEGGQVFDLIFKNFISPRIVISTGNLNLRMTDWIDKRTTSQENIEQNIETAKRDSRPDLVNQYVKPRNKLEEELAETWGGLLGINDIGVFDDFFDLGGHSLLATQLISRLRDNYKVDLPLRNLFESPNIATLSDYIQNSLNKKDSEEEAISQALKMVEGLSEQEAKDLLTRKSDQ